MEDYNPSEWYTPAEAIQKLSDNSNGKKIDESYLRTLAKIGKVERFKLGPKYSLYKKSQIDEYKVVGRGEKWSKNNKKKDPEMKAGEWICPTCGEKQERYAPMPHHLRLKDNPDQEFIACAECHHKFAREKRILKEAKGE